MKIEIKEQGTKEFYEEVVNVLMQYKKLIKDPECKLTDNFKSFRSTVKVAAVVFVFCMAVGFIAGWSRPLFISTAVLWVAGAMMLVYLNNMNKAVKRYLEDKRASVVFLDERGVAMTKDGSLVIRLAWSDVAFVRVFSESTCFFPKEDVGVVIAVINTYRDEIRDYMENNETGVRYIA